jgi:RNA 3'-terminal phosphate cyclase (ATP)
VRGHQYLLGAPIDYLQAILLPTVSQMGLKASIQLVKRGFYPRGGGIVTAEAVTVKQLLASRLPCHIVERMVECAGKTFEAKAHKDVKIWLECFQPPDSKRARDQGTGIRLVAPLLQHGVLGIDSLGELGKPAERVGWEAASNLIQQLAAVSPGDKFLGAQLIICMAVASGASTIQVSELTSHTVTRIAVSHMIAGVRFNFARRQGTPAIIPCGGQR